MSFIRLPNIISGGEKDDFMESWVKASVPKTNFFNDRAKDFILKHPENSNAMENKIKGVDGNRKELEGKIGKNVKSIFDNKLKVSAFSDTSEINENLLPRDTYEILKKFEKDYRCSTFVDKKLEDKNLQNLVEEEKKKSEEICSGTYRDKITGNIKNIKGKYDKMQDEWIKIGDDCPKEEKISLEGEKILKEIERIEKSVEEAAGRDG